MAPDFAYGHQFGLRQLRGDEVPLTAAECAEREALRAEYDQLEEAYGASEDLPTAVERRVTEIEDALALLTERPATFNPAEIARAGAFISIDSEGRLLVERGYVRPEDELLVAPVLDIEPDATPDMSDVTDEPAAVMPMRAAAGSTTVQPAPQPAAEPEEDEGIKPLPDRLMTELTTHRTLALRHAIGEQPEVAFLAALHALCLKVFYPYAQDTWLELDLKQVAFGAQAPGLSETEPAKAIGARHQSWASALPREAADLWDALEAADDDTRQRLFAHCVGSSVNAVHEAFNRRSCALANADRLADAVGLDMAAAGWRPTIDTYLGRVTKSRILQAVREAKGEHAAQLIDHLKKPEMAKETERLLGGTGWLPGPLRVAWIEKAADSADEALTLPAFLADEEDEAGAPTDTEEPQPQHIAAE